MTKLLYQLVTCQTIGITLSEAKARLLVLQYCEATLRFSAASDKMKQFLPGENCTQGTEPEWHIGSGTV